jgi:hypothetical protein
MPIRPFNSSIFGTRKQEFITVGKIDCNRAFTTYHAGMAEALSYEWFLVANNDKLSIKVKDQVTLGEDERGLLTLESRHPEQRWVTLAIDSRGELVVSKLHEGWQLESPGAWVSSEPGVVCIPGTRLELTNNQVYISHDLLRGKVVQELVLKPTLMPLPLDKSALPLGKSLNDERLVPKPKRVDELDIVLQEPEPTELPVLRSPIEPDDTQLDRTAVLVQESSTQELNRDDTRRLDDDNTPPPLLTTLPIIAQSIGQKALSTAARSPKPQSTTEQKSPQSGKQERNIWAPTALAASIGLVVAGYIMYPFGASNTEQEASPRVTSTTSGKRLEILSPTARRTTAVTTPDAIAIAASSGVQKAELNEPVVSSPSSVVVAEPAPVVGAVLTQQLTEAKMLIAQGFINWPERNAVSILGAILTEQPDHEEALLLLNDATRRYLNEAQKAYGDGFDEAAFDMLRQAEQFHPHSDQVPVLRTAWGLN